MHTAHTSWRSVGWAKPFPKEKPKETGWFEKGRNSILACGFKLPRGTILLVELFNEYFMNSAIPPIKAAQRTSLPSQTHKRNSQKSHSVSLQIFLSQGMCFLISLSLAQIFVLIDFTCSYWWSMLRWILFVCYL